VSVVTKPSREYPPGFVIAQSPAGGTRIRRNTITITVANGPPPSVVVPSVTGQFADDAAAALRAAVCRRPSRSNGRPRARRFSAGGPGRPTRVRAR